MGLLENISSSIVKAMKNKNNDELESLRAIKSALLLVKTQKNSGGEISEADEIKILQKLVKQRKESAEKKFWNDNRIQKAKKIGLSKLEVTNLASIVQKESIKIDERPTIAGVYINRLNKRMRLQADPTVIYSIKDYYKNFDTIIRRVLYRDLRLKSRYNTYRINGLPPGPIAMPDISAIDAVLNYEKHNYIFFVADPYNRGYHLFARNLTEHNQNKKVYTRWLNNRGIYR